MATNGTWSKCDQLNTEVRNYEHFSSNFEGVNCSKLKKAIYRQWLAGRTWYFTTKLWPLRAISESFTLSYEYLKVYETYDKDANIWKYDTSSDSPNGLKSNDRHQPSIENDSFWKRRAYFARYMTVSYYHKFIEVSYIWQKRPTYTRKYDTLTYSLTDWRPDESRQAAGTWVI